VRLSPLGTSASNWPIVPAQSDRWWLMWISWWNENLYGKPKYSEKACLNVTLSTINPIWLDLGSNPGRRGVKSATNRLRYVTAQNIVPRWRCLLGYRLRHSVFHTPFIADYTVSLTIALLQTVLSLTVLTIHTSRRLSWPSTISVGARLFTVDSRLSLPLLSPTTDYCLRRLAHRLSAGSLRQLSRLTLFAGWLADWLSSPAGSLPLCLRWLAHCLSVFAGWLTHFFFTLRNSCLKIGMCGRYSQYLVPRFVSALWRVGYRGNVCCVFTMPSSGFILGIANLYHGYNNVSLRRCVAVTIYPAVG
jgi:hypothetical protein